MQYLYNGFIIHVVSCCFFKHISIYWVNRRRCVLRLLDTVTSQQLTRMAFLNSAVNCSNVLH